MSDADAILQGTIDPLDRRIAAALQVDGRATWRQIADVLGEPVRTVSRRANALLSSGTVRVTAVLGGWQWQMAVLTCTPSAVDEVARTVAGRADVNMAYALSYGGIVLAEARVAPGASRATLSDELSEIPGVEHVTLDPMLQYFRTVADWRPGILTPAEVARLEVPGIPPEQVTPDETLDEVDAALVAALIADGRRPYDALGELVGISEPTARRRIESLQRRGVLRLRASVAPAVLGRPLETMILVDCPPSEAMTVGENLAASPQVCYAVMTMGEAAIVAHVASADPMELRTLVTDPSWTKNVSRIRSTTVLRAYKRSGLLV